MIGAGPTGEWRTICRLRGMPPANRRPASESTSAYSALVKCPSNLKISPRPKRVRFPWVLFVVSLNSPRTPCVACHRS